MLRGTPVLRLFAVSIWMILALACTSVPPHPEIDDLEQGVSNRLLHAHMASLEALYPRFPASNSDTIARAYLARELRLAGAEVRELADGERRHLVAEIPGASRDVVLLAAPYVALESGVWIDDSSAVLLLELARVFGSGPRPYTLIFALAEMRPVRLEPAGNPSELDSGWGPVLSFLAAQRHVSEAGESLARAIEAESGRGRVRAAIAFETSARTGSRIARDLRSHPGFRELFWESAAALGHQSLFPPGSEWSSPEGLHLGLRALSMDRVLALIDETLARPGPGAAQSPSDGSRSSFAAVGTVAAEALARLMRRFEKVDDFSR